MHVLKNNKNLPNIAHPLPLPHPIKNHSQNIHQHLTISHSQCLIINSSSFPLQLELRNMENVMFDVLITNDGIQVRNHPLRQNLPLQFDPRQWVKLDFGQNMKTIQVRPMQKENKSLSIPVYPSELAWRTAKHRIQSSLKEVSLMKPIVYLKNGIVKQFLNDSVSLNTPKNKIEKSKKMMKTRTNSTGLRPKLLSLRERTINISERSGNSKQLVSNFHKKKQSLQNSCEKQKNQSLFNKKRSFTSSNSSRLPSPHSNQLSRFNKTKRLKVTPFCEQIEIFQTKDNRFPKKPKFYEKIPFTFEQIELKRKKFDSQFIPTENRSIDLDLTNGPLKTEQSAIIEDICIRQQSHLSKFQDTFEKGVQKSVRPANNFSQSGTLCQSVFQ